MHILIAAWGYPTKTSPANGAFIRAQAVALAEAGKHKVGVLALLLRQLGKGHIIPRTEDRIKKLVDESVTVHFFYGTNWLPKIPFGSTWLWLRTFKKMFRLYVAREGLPDVVHVHSAPYGGWQASKILKEYNIPFVLTEHSTLFGSDRIPKWQRPLIMHALSHASTRIAVSPQLANAIEAKYNGHQYPWKIVPNIIDRTFFEQRLVVKAPNIKQEFSFLNIALMTERKGQADLILAFQKAFSREEDVSLTIGGDGPCRTKLESLVEKQHFRNRIRFTGMLDQKDVINELTQCDVFVLSSYYETFGVVLAEAMACGKPVISTSCGGPESVVEQGTGILVPSGNIDEMANAMRRIKNEIHRYEPNLIRENCYRRFGPEVVAKELENIYLKACSK